MSRPTADENRERQARRQEVRAQRLSNLEALKERLMKLLDENDAWNVEKVTIGLLRRHRLQTFKLPSVWPTARGDLHVWIATDGNFYAGWISKPKRVWRLGFTTRRLPVLKNFNRLQRRAIRRLESDDEQSPEA